MLIKRPVDIKLSEVTDQRTYLDRRKFLATSALGAIAGGLGLTAAQPAAAGAKLGNVIESSYRVDDELTDYGDITSYNNFYEFGTNKTDPARNSHTLVTKPWSLAVSGACES
ncbi:MAG: mononuclear molybdenum enzyme YedY, partial [Thiotrichales bacterium]|nr:mononuclear molybdenum enzyme YedY [Thiotrichales bacterium]